MTHNPEYKAALEAADTECAKLIEFFNNPPARHGEVPIISWEDTVRIAALKQLQEAIRNIPVPEATKAKSIEALVIASGALYGLAKNKKHFLVQETNKALVNMPDLADFCPNGNDVRIHISITELPPAPEGA